MRKFNRGAINLSLILLLSGCAKLPARTETVVEYKPVYRYPADALLEDCPEYDLQGNMNGDLAVLTKYQQASLKRCNRDKAALREWSATAKAAERKEK